MASKKRKGMEEEEHKAEAAGMMRWLLTYADMITLLLGMFIVIAGVRSESEAKFRVIAEQAARVFGAGISILQKGHTGILEGGTGVLPYIRPPKEAKEIVPPKGTTVLETSMGTLITISSGILFDSGSAEPKPEAKQLIDQIYKIYFATSTNSIVIKGHTDDRPISNIVYPSNWELSTGRAGSVTRYLITKWNIPPTRITTAGYADTDPVAPNVTPEGRSKNRRVEIWLLRGAASRVMKEMQQAGKPGEAGKQTETEKQKDIFGGGEF